ncbi:hypothetical protein [Prauserella cavernicola]|nr:hypothetical protein [Prauserella cavernicola]
MSAPGPTAHPADRVSPADTWRWLPPVALVLAAAGVPVCCAAG